MRGLLHTDRPGRFLATLVTLCYCWLCMAFPFEHTHHVTEDAETFVNLPGVHVHGHVSLPTTTHLSKTSVRVTVPCLSCEWQATIVSPALGVYALSLPPRIAPQIVTILPRAVRGPTFEPT